MQGKRCVPPIFAIEASPKVANGKSEEKEASPNVAFLF